MVKLTSLAATFLSAAVLVMAPAALGSAVGSSLVSRAVRPNEIKVTYIDDNNVEQTLDTELTTNFPAYCQILPAYKTLESAELGSDLIGLLLDTGLSRPCGPLDLTLSPVLLLLQGTVPDLDLFTDAAYILLININSFGILPTNLTGSGIGIGL